MLASSRVKPDDMYGDAIGPTLYEHVVEYAALGDHRTGTAVDDVTRSWFRALLADIGGRVEEVPYGFERYEVRAHTRTRDGAELHSLPVYYSGVGDAEAEQPAVVELPMAGLFPLADLDEVISDAPGEGPVVVIVDGPEGRLVAMNRAPVVRPGRLAVLAGGSERRAIEDGRCRVTGAARLVPGASGTVVGSLGDEADDPVVVTTPLTGWFACAGERGTGIAIALDLARRLAARHPVVVVGTTGHELEFLGARRYLVDQPIRPRAVVHLGAGMAAGDPGPDGEVALGQVRIAMTTAPDPEPLLATLASAGFGPGFDGPWPGEGELWRETGAPVLSMVGGFERFHTPDDLPAAVTSAELLARVSDAVGAAVDRLLD